MPKWMDELEELTKGMSKPDPKAKDKDQDYDDDGDDGDGEDGDGEPFGKSASVKIDKYPPADNGDDDDEESGAAVRDPDKIDKLTRGGKLKKPNGVNAGTGVVKSVRELVDEPTADTINAADALGCIADAVDHLAQTFAKSLRGIVARIERMESGQEVIGNAVAKSLAGSKQILKSLQGEVDAIAAQPRGRRSVAKGVERRFAGNEGGAPPPIDRRLICEKSLAALKDNRISLQESSAIESFLNGSQQHGRPPMLPPPHLMEKIGMNSGS